MAPQIEIADLPTRLANCAAWNLDKAEEYDRLVKRADENGDLQRLKEFQRHSERHHWQAFQLFRAAQHAHRRLHKSAV